MNEISAKECKMLILYRAINKCIAKMTIKAKLPTETEAAFFETGLLATNVPSAEVSCVGHFSITLYYKLCYNS